MMSNTLTCALSVFWNQYRTSKATRLSIPNAKIGFCSSISSSGIIRLDASLSFSACRTTSSAAACEVADLRKAAWSAVAVALSEVAAFETEALSVLCFCRRVLKRGFCVQ